MKEYLIWEWPDKYAFRVWICEDNLRIAERWFYSLDSLLDDAIRWHKFNKKARIAMEFRSGETIDLSS